MKAFIHNGRTYLRVIPSKFMMNSTMIYDITTRGDVLALDVETQKLVVVKGTEQVEHQELNLYKNLTPAESQIYKDIETSLLEMR
jgi:hypothetical protein